MIQRRRRQGKNQAFEQINITPFTDVLLVLLIIFMIAGSSLVPTGVELQGLAAEGASGGEATSESVAVWLTADGASRWERDGVNLSPDQLSSLPRSTQITLLIAPKTRAEVAVREYERWIGLGFSRVSWGPPAESP